MIAGNNNIDINEKKQMLETNDHDQEEDGDHEPEEDDNDDDDDNGDDVKYDEKENDDKYDEEEEKLWYNTPSVPEPPTRLNIGNEEIQQPVTEVITFKIEKVAYDWLPDNLKCAVTKNQTKEEVDENTGAMTKMYTCRMVKHIPNLYGDMKQLVSKHICRKKIASPEYTHEHLYKYSCEYFFFCFCFWYISN